jgi:hypothetical protein
MHEAVTKSSAATNLFFSPTTEDLLPPVILTNRSQAADTLSWSQNHELEHLENWQLPTSNETNSNRRTTQSLQKFSFPSNMPSRTMQPDNNSSSDRGMVGPNNTRWRFNDNGQLVDSEAASSGWDLADEIVRLKIGNDDGEDVQIRTPPKSKIATAGVVALNETSPLETSSDASIDSSPHASEHQISISHSRGSSTDTTTSSSQESATSQILLAPSPLKVTTVGEVKERPHSFSGGLSTADLRRLQQAGEGPVNLLSAADPTERQMQQWSSSLQYREPTAQFPTEQLTYPSLANQSASRPQPQQQHYDYRSAPSPATLPHGDELRVDYNIQQRNFNPLSQGPGGPTAAPPSFIPGRPNNVATGIAYRQPPRGFPPQGLHPAPTTLGYPGGHHTSHLSLGNTQQLYDMMLPGPPNDAHPAVARVQQQHNVFRSAHHHSASDPSAMRDAATLAMLNSNMQAFAPPAPAVFPAALSMHANQFYGTQDAYPRPDVATAQAMAARLQAQYTDPYGATQGQGMGVDSGLPSPGGGSSQNGPSANNRKLGLYKTELCRSWEEKNTCRYGAKCQFAHGEDEIRKVSRHPKYKTEICRTFWVSGSCPYGKRCCFIHTELPTSGASGIAPGGVDSAPPPPRSDGRVRSPSIGSDPNEASVSLLARISAKRGPEGPGQNNGATPVDMSPPLNGFQFNSRPPTGSLRVDTSALDNPVVKQNKSAYPSFASNGILLPAPEQSSVKSPVPVTAGPDLGRHNNSRVEIVGYNQQRLNKTASASSTARHSFNGTEVDISSPPSVSSGHSAFGLSSAESVPNAGHHAPRPNGHVRSGSAGNWGSFPRTSHLAPSPYPHSSSPGGEVNMQQHSPWSTSELAVGSSRLNEKAWA